MFIYVCVWYVCIHKYICIFMYVFCFDEYSNLLIFPKYASILCLLSVIYCKPRTKFQCSNKPQTASFFMFFLLPELMKKGLLGVNIKKNEQSDWMCNIWVYSKV